MSASEPHPSPGREPAAAPRPSPSGRVAGDTGTVMASEVVSIVLRYGGSILTSRILGLSWFGSFTLGLTVARLLGMVSTMGVSPGVLPFLARARRSGRPEEVRAVVRATWALVGWASLSVATLAFALSPWLARVVFDEPRLVAVLRPLCLLIVLSALTTAGTSMVQGFLGVRVQAVIDRVLIAGVSVAGLVLAWLLDWGLPGALAATVAGPLVGLLVAARYVSELAPGALGAPARDAAGVLRELLRESWPLMGIGLSAFVLTWMDVLLMGVFRGPEEVGIYGACVRLAPAVMLVNNAAGPVFLARLSKHFTAGDWTSIRELYRTTGSWSLWAGLVMAAMLVVWSRELLALFGPEFVVGTSVLWVLALGRAASAVGGMCGRMLSITGKARLGLANLLGMIVLNGLLDVVWIPRHGALGAATATGISIAAVNLLQTVEVWSIFRVHPFTWRSLLGLLGIPALGALAWLWRDGPGGSLGWLVSLALFLLASAALYLVGGAGEEDRAFLRGLVRRVRR